MKDHDEARPGWAKGPNRKSLPVNGELIRDLRKTRGLTQEQLAELAGYSPRLIRKAESGRSLNADTVEVIAEALSTPAAPVSPETLTADLRAMVRAFSVSYAHDEIELVSQVKSIFAPNVIYKMAGDPELIPFAGEYHGRGGVDQWARNFFNTFERPVKDMYRPTLYQAGTSVLAVGHDAVVIPGFKDISHSITVLRYEFERGKVVLVDNDYDTHGAVAFLERHQASKDQASGSNPDQ